MTTNFTIFPIAIAVLLAASGCVRAASSPGTPNVPGEYLALPDTLVCVVTRAAPQGLMEVPAKVRAGSVVLFVDNQIQPLQAVHPIDLIAGYAGEEDWFRRGDPVTLRGERFSRTGGERRVDIDLLRRVGDFRGILLFSGLDDFSRPNALYVPSAPGCIFQAYVRDDLLRP